MAKQDLRFCIVKLRLDHLFAYMNMTVLSESVCQVMTLDKIINRLLLYCNSNLKCYLKIICSMETI